MIKIVQYKDTLCSMKFKKFIDSDFSINLLTQTKYEINVIFVGWSRNNLIEHMAFTNENNDMLTFHTTHYEICRTGQLNHRLPLPQTINDFINDMFRFKVDLYWDDIIDEMFEPKEYLHMNNIHQYYTDLLSKMNKSYELL